ncbi:unnamed protein product [Urochloa humidicola]
MEALRSVLQGLTTLLGDQYKLLDWTRSDIMVINSELEAIHSSLLRGASVMEDSMMEVRKLSYDLEEHINDFVLSLERGGSSFVQQPGTAAPFVELKERVRNLSERIRENSRAYCGRLATDDPKSRPHGDGAMDLVDMVKLQEDLVKLMEKHEMVCVVGFSGMGGAGDLGDLLYRAIGDQFQCWASVSLSASPSTKEIASTILRQVNNPEDAGAEALTEQCIIDSISNFLQDKRFLVIIDDIRHWREWEMVRKSLPKNNLGNRIIMTTPANAIAGKCCTNSNAFVYEIGAASDNISPSSTTTVDSSCCGYYDLPIHLKNCLLYCVVYPESHRIKRGHLVLKWIDKLLACGDKAESYFDELISRSLIRRVNHSKSELGEIEIDAVMPSFDRREAQEDGFVASFHNENASNSEVVEYEIDPVMLSFLRREAQEGCFVTCLHNEIDTSSLYDRRIRRLSIQNYQGAIEVSRMDLSRNHSLSVFCDANRVPFKQFERLQVLDLEYSEGLENAHLVDICELKFLRCLRLKRTQISELPPQIGRLQNLETLDVRSTQVRELPVEVCQLPKLVCVLADERVKLPNGIVGSDVSSKMDLLLSRLADRSSMVTCDRLGLRMEPRLGSLTVAGKHVRVPRFVKTNYIYLSSLDIRLCRLDEDDLEFLRELPYLQVLTLRFEATPRWPISVPGGGFRRLRGLCIDCRLPRVTFERGAMPELKYLEFLFYAGRSTDVPAMGVTRLRSLQKIVFRSYPWYRSDAPGISAIIDRVRKEAAEHPNEITLYVNDMTPEVFGSGARWISQASKVIIGTGIEETESMREQRMRLYRAAESRRVKLSVVQARTRR